MRSLKLKNGKRVPGASTIAGLLDKPFLVKRANKLGKQGIDVEEYVDNSAKQGTLIHNSIEAFLKHEKVDTSDFNEEQIAVAKKSFNKFLKWYKQNKIEFIASEEGYVSENYKYGGFIDCYCKLNDKYTIIDFKTSKSISKEHLLQLSAYKYLLEENNVVVEQIMILNVPKEEGYNLDYEYLSDEEAEQYFSLFKELVKIYYLKKDLDWEK